MTTITSANIVFALLVPDVFPVPQILEGFAVDDAFMTDNVDSAEVQMGVDGHLSAGFTPFPVKMTLALQANSPSILVFDTWFNAMKSAKEVFRADATILVSSTRKIYTCVNGYLTGGKMLADAKKVLQPVQYTITWERINPAAV